MAENVLTNKRSLWGLSISLVFIAFLFVAQAATTPMWYDEIATYEPAKLAHLNDTLSFFSGGYDTPSPIPALLLRGSLSVFGDSDISDRLFFIAGFLGVCWFVYHFVNTRYTNGYALAAIFFLAAIEVKEYATTMRAYVFLLLASAAAVYCWQQIALGRNGPSYYAALWFSLALAVLSHVFGIFLLVPMAVAELYRTVLKGRELDRKMWIVFCTAPLALIVLVPSILAARAHYSKGFWSRPTPLNLVLSYTAPIRKPGYAIAAIGILAAFVCGRFLSGKRKESAAQPEDSGFQDYEWVLILGLWALPVIGFAGALVLGAFVHRYVIPVTLGIDFAFIGLLARLAKNDRRAGTVLAGCFALAAVAAQSRAFTRIRQGYAGEGLKTAAHTMPWAQTVCSSGLPVLAATPHDFLVYQHYAPACVASKLFYAIDSQKSAQLSPMLFTDEQNMIWFSKRIPLRVTSLQDFLSRYPEFFVLSSYGRGQDNSGWLLTEADKGNSPFTISSSSAIAPPVFDGLVLYRCRRN